MFDLISPWFSPEVRCLIWAKSVIVTTEVFSLQQVCTIPSAICTLCLRDYASCQSFKFEHASVKQVFVFL